MTHGKPEAEQVDGEDRDDDAEDRLVESVFRLAQQLEQEASQPLLTDEDAAPAQPDEAHADELIAAVGSLLLRLGDHVPHLDAPPEQRHLLLRESGPDTYERAERIAELLDRLPPGALDVPVTAAQIRAQIRRAQRMERLQIGLQRLTGALDQLRRRTRLEVTLLQRHLGPADA